MIPIRLIVGLGNPGSEYATTRHNAGFWWLDELAQKQNLHFKHEAKFHGLAARTQLHGHEMLLLKPQTFMNVSGRAVAALAQFYKITPAEILVVHDELDLSPGVARLKMGGGHGGHNGLKDIAAALGTGDFWRLRIGIGHPRDGALSEQEVADYVLRPPAAVEQSAIDGALARALQIWPRLASGEMERAMHELHTRADDEPPSEKATS